MDLALRFLDQIWPSYSGLITAIISFFLNLGVTLFLIKREGHIFGTRRTNDRNYQSQIFLYQTLIIKDVENYIDSANQVEKIFIDLCASLLKTGSVQTRKKIEKAQEDVDIIDRQTRVNLISKTRVFSKTFSHSAEGVWTDFYDKCTLVITKLNRASLTQEICHRYRSEMSTLREKFIDEIVKLIQSKHPVAQWSEH
jgi:hypothetical protein